MRLEMSWDGSPQALQEGFFTSANFRKMRVKQKAVCVTAKTREDTVSVTREHKFISGYRGDCVSKNLDETVRPQSEKRQEWIGEVRGKRLQGIAVGGSSAPRLANSSAESEEISDQVPIVA